MQLVAAYNAPVMVTDLGAIAAADRIHAHTAKLHIEDRKRVAAAIEWYQGVIRTVNQLQLQQELAIGAKNAPFLGHLYILLKIFEKTTIFTKTGSGQT